MTHYNVQFKSAIPELATVSSLEQERFQGMLEHWRGTHQLELCWQLVPCHRLDSPQFGVCSLDLVHNPKLISDAGFCIPQESAKAQLPRHFRRLAEVV